MNNVTHTFFREGILIIEQDFNPKSVILLQSDVYDMTIAANIAKKGKISPTVLHYCIKQCIVVFLI